jgi:hypothetical protein
VDIPSVIPYFMESDIRTVHRDFSDVQFRSMFFRVDPSLRGDKVEVRIDPFGDKQSVLIYSLTGQRLCRGIRHDRDKTPQPPHRFSQAKAKHDFLKLCMDEHRKRLDAQAQGIDFLKLSQAKSWSLTAFAKTLADLMGLKGGVTAFSTPQFEAISRVFHQCPCIDKPLLIKAFEDSTGQSSLPEILYHIKTLAQKSKPKE